jgi:hypothetical protein
MFDLFYMGGPVFMSILTLIFIAVIVVFVVNGLPVLNGNSTGEIAVRKISYIKAVGLFGLMVGILEQLIGLYQAFVAIEMIGEISPAMLAGGIKVSMISTIYGMIIYVISYLIWLGLSTKLKGAA